MKPVRLFPRTSGRREISGIRFNFPLEALRNETLITKNQSLSRKP